MNKSTSLTSRTQCYTVTSFSVKVILFYQRKQGFSEKMFESLAASILNGILGKYIKDLDSSNLNLGILKGEKTHDLYQIRSSSTKIKQVKYLLKYLK